MCLIYSLQLMILANMIVWTRAEVFTAMYELPPLLDTHRKIVDDLEYFIEKEEQRLHVLDKHLHVFKMEHWKATGDIPNYVGKPINAFSLVKRLTIDIQNIADSIRATAEYEKNITLLHADVKYPATVDLTGAAQGLVRLQKVYNLNIRDLSDGILNGVMRSTPMSASDCYELGRALYHVKDFKHALLWMKQALRKRRNSNDLRRIKEADVLDYLSFLYYLLGDYRNALEWTQKLLNVAPMHSGAPGNLILYQKMVESENDKPTNKTLEMEGEDKQEQIYRSLCRGELDIPAKVSKRLYCRYVHEHHSFLRLAPIKMELLYWRPRVALFHQVLSDQEIHLIKELATPKLERATVQNPTNGELVPAIYRISKSGWVSDEESPRVARVTRRVSDMTGLSVRTAEDLEVINYGIGGQYDPHFDFFLKNASVVQAAGTRIASILLYMSDVEEGGATVFPELGLSVFPIKGAALFWLNLHPSGEGDFATLHAGCPVLRGDKWVGVKWIHQAGQELRRPCSLSYQAEGIAHKLPQPMPRTAR